MFISFNNIHLIEKLYIITAFMTGFGSILLGLLVYFKNKNNELNKRYFLMSLNISVWSFGLFLCHISYYREIALFWNRFLHFAAIFIPITFIHFVISLLGKTREKKSILFIGYIYSLILSSFAFTSLIIKDMAPKFYFRIWPIPGILYPAFLLSFCVYFTYCWILTFKEYKKSTGIRNNQLKYILIGLTIGYIGGSTNYAYFYNIPIIPIGNAFVFFYVILYAYAIVAYHLLDIRLVIARTFILFCVYSCVLSVVALAWYPMRPALQAMLGEYWYLVPLGIFALLSMAAPFAYLHYQQKYDQRRLKRQRAQLTKLKQITAASIDLDYEQLLKNMPPFLMQMYRDDFQTDIDCIAVYFVEKNQNSYRLASYKSKRTDISFETNILKTDPIPSWFIEKAPYYVDQKKLLDPSYLESFKSEDLEYYQSKQTDKDLINAISNVRNSLKALKAEVCVSCIYKERLLAFLLMGKKQKGSYAQEELDTFSLLAHDVASAVRSGELREDLEQSYIDAIHAIITALEERDPYTKGHSERVVKYSTLIAEELKDTFPFTRILNLTDKVKRAALLHDVGKIGVPDSILLKPGKLTDEEYTKLKQHPTTSLHIIQSIKNLSEDIREGIESHHERYDGKGYGKGSQGHRVPPIARIIAVADTFDAMTSDRPYRKAKEPIEAVNEIINNSAIQFDPDVVMGFTSMALSNCIVKIEDIKSNYFTIQLKQWINNKTIKQLEGMR